MVAFKEKARKASVFVMKQASSRALQAILTECNFAVGSNEIEKSISNADLFEFK